MSVTFLRHNRIELALHELRGGTGRPLLLLHGLGERTPDTAPEQTDAWPGPVYGLDFTGHGQSTVPRGGGYSAEILMADADHALAEIGTATVVGRGLGAYVALLLAGGRASLVRGTVLCDGPSLWGGATGPTSSNFMVLPPSDRTPDPYALLEMSRDLRPPDYAALFARMAVEQSGLDEPITVAAALRPPWLDAVVNEMGVVEAGLPEALRTYAAV